MSENGLNRERLSWIYTQMLRIREFEERVKRTFEESPGVIRGHTHLADGADPANVTEGKRNGTPPARPGG